MTMNLVPGVLDGQRLKADDRVGILEPGRDEDNSETATQRKGLIAVSLHREGH